ncbi:MAG: sulfite exporter TauE/SafE family protein [Candidatus Wallbacteria bacterium]|nr:sulfite exporter TauE/SafE family protein [Candidatus Wallbacteria bacterium]
MMESELLAFLGVGFLAELIDGALGMAYGVTSTTCLLGLGLPPAAASVSVHFSEVFTTAASGAAHWRLGNVDVAMCRRLAVAGMAGSAAGAYLLTTLPGSIVRPCVAAYLLAMGLVILRSGFRPGGVFAKLTGSELSWLGTVGGFLDALGGGGWGPIVTSTLMARGGEPRRAIGTVNCAEFFVTMAAATTFVLTVDSFHWTAIGGLIGGGLLAAPVAARLTSRVPPRLLALLVGLLIVGLSCSNLAAALG